MAMPALVPRSLLGHPERSGAVLSPDGQNVAYLAPSGAGSALWMRSLSTEEDRLLYADHDRPIGSVFWSPDGSCVFFLQDCGGDENFHLFAVVPGKERASNLTPYDGVKVEILSCDYSDTERVLLLMNARDPHVYDVYSMNLATAEIVLDTQNDDFIDSFICDANLSVRAGIVQQPDATVQLLYRLDAQTPWHPIVTFAPEDGWPQLVGFSRDGLTIFVITSAGANSARLCAIDTLTAEIRSLCEDPIYDVSSVLCSSKTHNPIAACVIAERKRWHVLDTTYAGDFELLSQAIPGDFSVESCDAQDELWLILSVSDERAPAYFLYDRSRRTVKELFSIRPKLARYALSKMRPVAYPARDGRIIHGYLTVPGETSGNLPTVLLVHGGPWLRDLWGYNRVVQWLSNRGYAVMQPNFRGSTGYGKAHMNAGDRQWAGSMFTDLLDAREWLIAQGITDPERIAIMGGSYGGYAVLNALSLSPDAFACGVDIVGPSNLHTLLESIPPYWETQRATFTRRMGEDPEFLAAHSPLHRAASITKPLLIGQGANDPRVKKHESDAIVEELRSKGREVTYVVFDDEGHGFVRPQNAMRFNAIVEQFLAQHIGGRFEPAAADEQIHSFLR